MFQVGHLAVVHEDDVARVLSWHLASDMDCVITTTTEQVGNRDSYTFSFFAIEILNSHKIRLGYQDS